MSLLDKIRQLGSGGRPPDDPHISVLADGFSVAGAATLWSDIVEIGAFKLDLLTTDEVRFRIALQSGDFVELSEEQPGFADLIAALTAQFPSVANWVERVIQPPFARNATTLYRRA